MHYNSVSNWGRYCHYCLHFRYYRESKRSSTESWEHYCMYHSSSIFEKCPFRARCTFFFLLFFLLSSMQKCEKITIWKNPREFLFAFAIFIYFNFDLRQTSEIIDRLQDVLISFLPLAHMFERLVETLFFMFGLKVGYYSGDVKNLIEDIKELKPTVVPLVPRVLNRIYSKVYCYSKFIASVISCSALQMNWSTKILAFCYLEWQFFANFGSGGCFNIDILMLFRIKIILRKGAWRIGYCIFEQK